MSTTAAEPIHDIIAQERRAPSWLIVSAFLAVYVIWGSTYLGIRLAIDSIPPLLMAGTRSLIAGTLLYGVMRLRGTPRPSLLEWRNAAIVGALLLMIGNGGVSWAQKTVPTSITALMIAGTPIWMNLMDWLRPGGVRPRAVVVGGLILGFCGVAIIALSKDTQGQNVVDPIGAVMLFAASFCWAAGSIFSRYAQKPADPLLTIGMQMIAGGALLLLSGAAAGELPHFHPSQITATSAWAFAYLTFFGSLVGFTAYVWLLQVSTPARVSTYAYVNPFIAVILGHLVLHERLPTLVLIAGGLILLAVVLLTTKRR